MCVCVSRRDTEGHTHKHTCVTKTYIVTKAVHNRREGWVSPEGSARGFADLAHTQSCTQTHSWPFSPLHSTHLSASLSLSLSLSHTHTHTVTHAGSALHLHEATAAPNNMHPPHTHTHTHTHTRTHTHIHTHTHTTTGCARWTRRRGTSTRVRPGSQALHASWPNSSATASGGSTEQRGRRWEQRGSAGACARGIAGAALVWAVPNSAIVRC